MAKTTQKEVIRFCESLGYEIINIDDYKDVNTELYLKDEDGYICKIRFNDLKRGKKVCKFYKSNPYTIQNIKLWMKTNAKGYELISTEYISSHDKMLFQCSKGHKFEMPWSSFQHGTRCPVCSNQKVLKGYNDIKTIAPWMINLGMSMEDAETYAPQSSKKITVKSGKALGKKVEIFKGKKSLGIFESASGLLRQSEELFGINMLQCGISMVCRGEKPQYKGFTFKYIK